MKKLEKIKKTVLLTSSSGKVTNTGFSENLFTPTVRSAQKKQFVFKGKVIEIKYNVSVLKKFKRY